MADQLLTVKEASKRFKTSESGMRWMIAQGTAPKSIKIGGRRLFKESDIDAYIEAAFAEAG